MTWKDWWASRTQRFNSYMVVLFSAAIPVLLMIDEATLVALGLDNKTVAVLTLVIGILGKLNDMRLRSVTTGPLAGRAESDS